ncbi:MAG TPA: alpha/beta hydrolase [Acidimicrobiales bacterium]|jgi:pimeloyl-ACP methyl ester carboxylesterase|nr:alpha/beta hydrolase [Acidimicrobiales bacterium]
MEPSEHRVNVNDLDVAYLSCGDNGPLAVCLHGFPDSAWTWRHLLPELAEAGFRAVAPWLRGYAPTGLDPNSRYQNGASVADVIALHDALGGDADAVLIGHDWGARIATGAAVLAPERWCKLVTAAVPPGAAVAQGFLTYAQLRKSWYMFFFQNPLAEFVLSMNDFEFIDHLWADWSPGYDATGDLVRVKDALRPEGHLAAAIEYYRATINPAEHTVPELQAQEEAIGGTPVQPHLYLHGETDGCMGVEIAHMAEAFMTRPDQAVEIVKGAGHFLQLEQPALVNEAILGFLL